MKKQFVTYKIALELKELGFNELCSAYWFKHEYKSEKEQLIWSLVADCDYNSISNSEVSAPLWQQAEEWFRDKHNFHIVIWYNELTKRWRIDSIIDMSCINFYDHNGDNYGEHSTYPEVREDAFSRVIEMIKTKNG